MAPHHCNADADALGPDHMGQGRQDQQWTGKEACCGRASQDPWSDNSQTSESWLCLHQCHHARAERARDTHRTGRQMVRNERQATPAAIAKTGTRARPGFFSFTLVGASSTRQPVSPAAPPSPNLLERHRAKGGSQHGLAALPPLVIGDVIFARAHRHQLLVEGDCRLDFRASNLNRR
jgi:hypothetical protein